MSVDRFPLKLTLDGQAVEAVVRPGQRLSEVLREQLGARDVKIGCNAGDCGACTVLIDGAPVCACLTAAHQAEGRLVETLRGLMAKDSHAHALAESFQDHGAAQCGICTPGMMVSAVALLRQQGKPDESAVQDALGGVLCRCTGYLQIIDAVLDAAQGRVAALPDSSAVGAAIPRLDGAGKVDGTERYGADAAPEDALWLRVVRSPHASARFTLGDLDAARDALGLAAILSARDVPGVNGFGIMPNLKDQPVFADGMVRHRGQPLS